MPRSAAPKESTKQQVLERARALVPGFRKRADATESARRLPDESVQEMLDAGLPRILIPREIGGYGLGLDTWFEVVREIAKADTSHGWCASLYIHHPHYLCQFPAEAQKAVWAGGVDLPIAGAILPVTKVTPVDGGYKVSGHSPFASGITHSKWSFVAGFVEGNGPPEWTFFVIPPGDYKVIDTWDTAGMCGTGSNTIVTDDIFVPASHSLTLTDLREGNGPGGKLHASPIFRTPFITYAPLTFVTPMLGAAQGAYELLREWTKERKGPGGMPVAEVVSMQVRLARTAADLDAAEMLIQRAVETSQAAQRPTPELRARCMRDYARAAEIVVASIDTIMTMAGSVGFGASHPIQRAWRDIHFAACHTSLNPEGNFSHFGRMELGLPLEPFRPFY